MKLCTKQAQWAKFKTKIESGEYIVDKSLKDRQGFFKFADDTYPDVEGVKFSLNHTLLFPDLNILSPLTLVWVPLDLQRALESRGTIEEAKLQRGVAYRAAMSCATMLGGRPYLGTFPTRQAAVRAINKAKAKYIMKVMHSFRCILAEDVMLSVYKFCDKLEK